MPASITEEQRLQINKLFRSGMTCRSIAKEMGIGHSTVHRHIATNGSSISLAQLSNRGRGKTKASPKATPTRTHETKYSFHPFTPAPDGPICNASMTERYQGRELLYRK